MHTRIIKSDCDLSNGVESIEKLSFHMLALGLGEGVPYIGEGCSSILKNNGISECKTAWTYDFALRNPLGKARSFGRLLCSYALIDGGFSCI
jgi:hypothetical protein